MGIDRTIIISCAGMGKRLGIGCPKALVEVEGEPLIIRTLKQLGDCKDIRIVVGYQAEKVIDVVTDYRKDITFVFNHDYMNNGTAASVSLAAKYAKKYILTIDGDLLVHPDDMKEILNSDEEFVGVTGAGTDNPVLTKVKNGFVELFSREFGEYEWTGVCQIKTERLRYGEKHLYHLLEPLLPLKYKFIRTKEIDTPNDYESAVNWVKNNYTDKIMIGLLGGMGSYATVNIFKRLVDLFPAEKEWERPRIIVDNYCTMPSRVRAVLYGENKEILLDLMQDALNNFIKQGCSHILIGCNTAHILIKELYGRNNKYKRYVVDLIDETAKHLDSCNIESVFLMGSEGTIDSKVYENALKYYKITCNTPNVGQYVIIREFIESVKQNNITNEILEKFVNFTNSIEDKDIILGCTELPILFEKCKQFVNGKTIIDPIECAFTKLRENNYEELKNGDKKR